MVTAAWRRRTDVPMEASEEVEERSVEVALLLVEDNPADARMVCATLDECYPRRYVVTVVESLAEARGILADHTFDAALLDLSLPDSEGLETIGRLAAAHPELPVVVLTGVDDEAVAMEAVRSGSQDYLLKGQADGPSMARAIRYAIDRKKAEELLVAEQVKLEAKNRELEKAHRQLQAYRDRYIDLYDSAPLGYATLDGDGYVQEINLAGASLVHADRNDIIGFPFSQFVAPDDQQAFLTHVHQCVNKHREITTEVSLVGTTGKIVEVQLRSIPLDEPETGSVLCKTAITDLTEHRQMEEAIRSSRAFLQTIIDAMPDIMMVIDRDFRVVQANRAARQAAAAANIPDHCLLCYQIVLNDHNRTCAALDQTCPLREVVATGKAVFATHVHYDDQGQQHYVDVSASPVFDASNQVTHIVELRRDVTERKLADKALAHERDLLRTLIDNLPDCIYVKDVEGRFVAANLATARVMGASAPEEILGRTDFDFYPEDVARQYWIDEEQLLRSGQPLLDKVEPRIDVAGNRTIVLTTKVPIVDSEGKITGLVGISRVIHEGKCFRADCERQ